MIKQSYFFSRVVVKRGPKYKEGTPLLDFFSFHLFPFSTLLPFWY